MVLELEIWAGEGKKGARVQIDANKVAAVVERSGAVKVTEVFLEGVPEGFGVVESFEHVSGMVERAKSTSNPEMNLLVLKKHGLAIRVVTADGMDVRPDRAITLLTPSLLLVAEPDGIDKLIEGFKKNEPKVPEGVYPAHDGKIIGPSGGGVN